MYGNIQTMQSTLQFIAGQMKKPRERFETILEPLQALLQIGFLAFYPIGSKLAIHNNILTIQAPGYTQNVRRWYNNDKKEDVFYLYNVFSRFNKFYKTVLAGGGGENAALFTLLNELAKTGINNLTRTYNQTDKIHILHTLQMYKGMLDNPELARRLARTDDGGGSGGGGGAAVASIEDENNDADNHDGWLDADSTGDITITVPADGTNSRTYPVGTSIDIFRANTGNVTIAGSGATVNGTPGLKLRARYSSASLFKRAANSWVLIGDLTA
jgi:hypothetical protein